MKPSNSVLALSVCLLLASGCAAQEKAVEAARRFLPPGANFAQIERFESNTGKLRDAKPAVLTGHVVSGKTEDIIFAYYTRAADLPAKSLFVAVLHKTDSGYVKIYEVTHYGEFLWAQDASTMGLQLVGLPDDGREGIALITALGASLGARLKIFQWDPTWGLVNVMPDHGTAYHFSLLHNRGGPSVVLSFEKYPGEQAVRPPEAYLWDGKRFAATPR